MPEPNRFSSISLVLLLELLLGREYAGMEFEGLSQVGEKVGQTVVARIRVIFMLNALGLELTMQRLGTFFKAEIVFLAAVEVDREFPQASFIFPRQNKGTVLLPMRRVNRLAKNRAQQAPQRCSGALRGTKFLGGLCD